MITNKNHLPQAFVSLCESDYRYKDKQYSVTQLLKGNKEIVLERRHYLEVERDASDMIWLLFGTAVHSILERQELAEGQISEGSIYARVGEYAVSGRYDLYDTKTGKVTDYKTCSVYKVLKQDYEDWRMQTLLYCWGLRKNGFNASIGEIVAIMKDWRKSEARKTANYPKTQVKTIQFQFTDKDFAEADAFIKRRLLEIAALEELSDDDIPPCSKDERWHKDDMFAVMKGTNKRAVKLCASDSEANALVAQGKGTHVERRPGSDAKCEEYCSVCEWCNHYRSAVKPRLEAQNERKEVDG